MGIKEVGLASSGDAVVREQGVGTITRIIRSDTEDIISGVTDTEPFDFEHASGAAAVSLMGSVATARALFVKLLNATTLAPIQGTLSVNFGAGALSLTGSHFWIMQATANITAITVTHAAGVVGRIKGWVAG